MKKSIIILALIALLFSCTEAEIDPSAVNIRLANTSNFDYKNIVINTTTGNVRFGALDSGEYSEYKVFEKAYRYAYVELEINGNTLKLQPIDYVGETPLKNGKYTYEIYTDSPDQEYGSLGITLIKD
ncbi:hypothetical protein QYS49_13295 [Marivirga salinae]|uniref:DUF4625 domain-containing protein n=1 Tax=Marivirga salinarum TaxID=3059078 RepID=A0AA49GCT1_9BACT|nr:hypothetical protein [Marivirga sp. BDSF4-3]WKK77950.2 hypothetical protein QYS49_13295 [Marivirga sp. BDSF4-3]